MAYLSDSKAPSGHPLFDLANRLVWRSQRATERRGLKKMLDLDDHLLRDVGVTRDQVRRALNAPNAQDAATELQRLSLLRRTPWM